MDHLSAIGARAESMPETAARPPEKTGPERGSFSSFIEKAVSETERLQDEADGMVRHLAAGEITDVHQVMLAMNRADLSFRMMLEVRNKLLDAYQEVMRMQV
jgi:flagellar hook-basal body complex protein FliE